jgi:hypothetical protein
MVIRSLQRNVNYEEALRKLAPSGPLSRLRRWISGPLRVIAEIYIPYRLYDVTVDDRRLHSMVHYAVDAAVGTLDPYEFETPPGPNSWIELETRNFHLVQLDRGRTEKLVIEKVRRSLYSRGFFRLANPSITAKLIGPEFYIPYWAAFYGEEQNIRVTVLNAMHQKIEGSKVRQLVKMWLLERDSQSELNLEVLKVCPSLNPGTIDEERQASQTSGLGPPD